MNHVTRFSLAAITTLILTFSATAQVAGAGFEPVDDGSAAPGMQLRVAADELRVSGGTFGSECIVLIGLHDRHAISKGGLAIEPVAILARGKFDLTGEFRYRWPLAAGHEPLQFKIQALMPIDAKGARFSRAATLSYDGARVYEFGTPDSRGDASAKKPVDIATSDFAAGQGVDVEPGGLVIFGSAAVSSRPATIEFEKLRRATPEWRTIRVNAVRKGSARYDLLLAAMNQRIKKAVSEVARSEGCDCVLRRRDLKNAKGLTVVDLTKAVLGRLN